MVDPRQQPMNIEELLDGMNFPATRAEIVSYAQDRGASEEALEMLEAMPSIEYNSLSAVNDNLGLIERIPGSDNIWG